MDLFASAMMLHGGDTSFLREMRDNLQTSSTRCYQPRFVYGVQEKSEGKILSKVLLDRYAPRVQCFVEQVSKFYGFDPIYGCELTIDEALSGKKFKGMKAVDRFAKKLGFGTPEVHIALKGNYKIGQDEYEPGEDVDEGGDSTCMKEEKDVSSADGSDGRLAKGKNRSDLQGSAKKKQKSLKKAD